MVVWSVIGSTVDSSENFQPESQPSDMFGGFILVKMEFQ